MKKVLLLALISLCLSVPASEARPGRLDPSFGDRGQAAWPLPLGRDWEAVPTAVDRLPNGGSVALVGNRLIALDRSGDPMRRFWRGGFSRITIPFPAPSETSLTLVDMATDRDGRIVLVGTVTAPVDPSRQWVRQDETVLVVRLTPSGFYDRTFGEKGFLLTDLGFGPPPIEPPPGPPMEPPAVTRSAGVAIDAEGRIVLTGTGIARIGPCDPLEYYVHKDGFVARLQEDGDLDLSFGQGGLAFVPGVRSVQDPLLTKSGAALLLKEPDSFCDGEYRQVARVSPQGVLQERPGNSSEFFDSRSSLALDRRGRALVSWPVREKIWRGQTKPEKTVHLGQVSRLLANGAVDESFGRKGTATVKLPRGDFTPSQVLVDCRDRILVTGSVPPRGSRGDRGYFLLGRLEPEGELDRQFGRRGWARAKWGEKALVGRLGATFVKGGRLLLAGVLSDPVLKHDSGVGFARFVIR